jgi:hypothetical protein
MAFWDKFERHTGGPVDPQVGGVMRPPPNADDMARLISPEGQRRNGIRMAYTMFLGREPGEQEVQQWLGNDNFMAEIARSPEAQARGVAQPPEGWTPPPFDPSKPITEIPQGPYPRPGMPQPPLPPGTERPIEPWIPAGQPPTTGRGNLDMPGFFKRVLAPNGTHYNIPQSALQAALTAGGKLVG